MNEIDEFSKIFNSKNFHWFIEEYLFRPRILKRYIRSKGIDK